MARGVGRRGGSVDGADEPLRAGEETIGLSQESLGVLVRLIALPYPGDEGESSGDIGDALGGPSSGC